MIVKTFVNPLAACFSVEICLTVISFWDIVSLIKWYQISIYFIWRLNFGFSAKAMVLWLSSYIIVEDGERYINSSSFKILCNQTASLSALFKAIYSALQELSTPTDCLFKLQEIGSPPRQNNYALVDFHPSFVEP